METVYFWPDLPQAAVRGLQQAVLEERMDQAFVRAKGGCDKWHD
ncbi:MAG: hypothetical protein ACLR4W_09230 [Oscillospiraceae bacterium]